jgi:hypothetical protein
MSRIVKDEYIRFLDQEISSIISQIERHKEIHNWDNIPVLKMKLDIYINVKKYFVDITRGI